MVPLLALIQAAPQKQPKVADGGCFPTAHTLNYSASPQRPYLPSGEAPEQEGGGGC